MTHYTYLHRGADTFANPYRFSDIEDILEDPSKASAFFQDLLVNRPTEFSALIRLYMIASHNLDLNRVTLTNRQIEAVAYAHEGMEKGIHPTRYVATQLKISPRAVQRLLKRASSRVEDKMYANEARVPTYSEKKIRWYPTKAQIKAKIASMLHDCPVCGVQIKGRHSLCWECGKRFGFTREEFFVSKRKGEPAPAKWLLPLVRASERELYKDAVEELYKAYSLDDEAFEEAI